MLHLFINQNLSETRRCHSTTPITLAPAISICNLSDENVISRDFSFELEIYLTFFMYFNGNFTKKSRKHTTKFSNKKTKIVK